MHWPRSQPPQLSEYRKPFCRRRWVTGCDAIHPGFGFLSESPAFARLVETCGITFIGPSATVIEQMGDKATARRMVQQAGVPVVPGSEGVVENGAQAAEIARQIGYPVLIKAAAGGGGRGSAAGRTAKKSCWSSSMWPGPKPEPALAMAACTWKS